MENIVAFTTPLHLNPEAFASLENPTLSFMEFIFTDDKPNANNKGIPHSAFASIINTGIMMPLKMAEGRISPGHTGTLPLGVISSMEERKIDDRNVIVGKAALWSKERPDDIALIKEAYAAEKPVNISWEVLYTEAETDANGVEWFQDPIVRAATIVGVPAYKDRTRMLSVASDEEQEELTMNELEQAKADLETAQTKITDLESAVASKDTDLAAKETELTTLREFKASVEREQAQAQLLDARLAKFAEAGLKFSAEDVAAKKDKWLKLDDESFDYLVTEMQSLVKTDEASVHTDPSIPESVINRNQTKIALVRAGLQALKN